MLNALTYSNSIIYLEIPYMCRRFYLRVIIACFLASSCSLWASVPDRAEEILDIAGVRGGLVVHIGCDEGKLTAALRADDRWVVHGLDVDEDKVAAACEYVKSKGMYGPVSIDVFDGRYLPYADDLANLVVAEDLGEVEMDEVMRVLCPQGVACVKSGDEWVKTVKPRPEEMDEWTHFLHDASNNAVAADTRVGSPRRLRWVCGPLWARSHEFSSSLCAMVSAGGRIFYVFDEGLTGVTGEATPERWMLIARDAFNGVLLWKRPLERWGTGQWKNKALRSAPPEVSSRLVAGGDRVFMTLGYDAGVSALDAGTGEVLVTYEGTEGTQEVRCVDGVLVLRKGNNTVMAVDVESGKRLWEVTGGVRRLTLAGQDGRVFFQDGKEILCLGLKDGEELWRVEHARPVSLLVPQGGVVLLAGGKNLRALSMGDGDEMWAVDAAVSRNELFVAGGLAWHWEGERFVGRSLDTGEVAKRVDPAEVFTPGHHLRCYQSKATENYIITPYRGVEFVSIAGGEHTQNDWVRGPCKYGIMPCNGLLYAPPNPCFCYPGAKVTGFNALAPANSDGLAMPEESTTHRLQRGKAYGKAKGTSKAARGADWPTYRHDGRRTGAAAAGIGAKISQQWSVKLGGRLTQPVVAGRRVYVAARDEHTLYAMDMVNGEPLWHFTAGGRIDSAPTLRGDLVMFGCADGYAYCLHSSDGSLVWRFRAAPVDRRIIAFGQPESPWRVHGSILIKNDLAYLTAGRSSYLDGGITVFALDPKTGRVVHQAKVDTWARTRDDAVGKPFVPGYHMEGTHSDILVSQGDYIFMGQVKFDLNLVEQDVPYVLADANDTSTTMDLTDKPYVVADENPKQDYEKHQRDWIERTQKALLAQLHAAYGSHNLGDREMGLHVFSTAGFLDDTWFNRTYWMYSKTWPGYYLAHRGAKTGQLLAVGPERTYAVQAFPSRNLQSPLFTPGTQGYLLFADDNKTEPVLDYRTRGTTKGWGFTRNEEPVWHDWVKIRIRAMVLAGEQLFVAGPPDTVDPDEPYATFEGRKGGVLRVVAAASGKMLDEYDLPAPPVFDGMAAARGRLFVAATDGSVLCFGPEK